jgi:hypothetical protein
MIHMNNIEDDLKRALRRQEPPPDLASKIMGRVAAGEGLEPKSRPRSNKVLAFRPKPRVFIWLATAAAAACLVGLFVTRGYLAERANTSGPAVVAEKTEDTAPPVVETPKSSDDRGGPDNLKPKVVGDDGHKQPGMRSYHRRPASHPSEEARRAEEQLRLALAITSAKLGYAQRSIREVDGTGTSPRDLNR